MSLVSEGLIGQLKAEIERAKSVRYEQSYYTLQAALYRAIGALEQIDHSTKGFAFEVKVSKG